MTDIMSFPWEENYEEKNIEMSNEDRDRLREKAKAFEKLLKEQHGKCLENYSLVTRQFLWRVKQYKRRTWQANEQGRGL